VVRISGPRAPEILGGMFRKVEAGSKKLEARKEGQEFPASNLQPPASDWTSHHLYYGKIFDSQNQLLDQALAVWMKAPRSFTGEEVVEFHLHGGRLIALKVLEEVSRRGVRSAEAGEFSQRAFLNGKMDLAQAEAVADMIAAQSTQALKLAQEQWQGRLSGPVRHLRQRLLELLVNLEAAIDFPEEEIEIIDRKAILVLLEDCLHQIRRWLADYELGRIIREGLRVVLIGKPNVGKSSLLNLLTREEAALVHHEPGTTRDTVERVINLGGLALRIIDTAGIREGQGEVERMGIERSRQWFEKADLVLALFDTSIPLTEEDEEIIDLASKKRCLFLLNKVDLPPAWDPIALALGHELIPLSAKTGEGLKALEEKIPSLFGLAELEKGDHLLLNQLRHKEALEKGEASLRSALKALEKGMSTEFIATDVMAAVNHLGEIIGEVTSEHILEDIFSKFCIGK